jgi:hypothetical protein
LPEIVADAPFYETIESRVYVFHSLSFTK